MEPASFVWIELMLRTFIYMVHHVGQANLHGGLLSLNAWKLGPTPQNIEVVASPHSNEPSNRCPLEPAVHEVHET